jgi:hypothetical protein
MRPTRTSRASYRSLIYAFVPVKRPALETSRAPRVKR